MLNVQVEGVAAILLGDSLTASTNPPSTATPQVMLLIASLIPIVWIVGSYLSIRRWQQRGELPLHGIRRLWRFYLPLAVDLGPMILAWLILPAQFHTPMETIALFAPDVFVVLLMLTALSLGWALARSLLTLRPRRVIR